MGAFALIRHEAGAEATQAKVQKTLEERGFNAIETLDICGHTLLWAPKIVSPVTNLVRRGNGDLAAATGTIFYRDRHADQALALLLDDARAGRIDETSLRGCYATILAVGGRLLLFIDRLGTYKVYRRADGALWTSSFLACLAGVETPTLDPQSVYEYVFQGATYGDATMVREITLAAPDRRYQLAPEANTEPRPWTPPVTPLTADPSAHMAASLASLRGYFAVIAEAFGDRIDTALSGGYDSRLTLALLREQGVTPRIHVYGRDTDGDVIVAKAIAAGEGFPLLHENKNRLGDDSPAGVAAAVAAQFLAFDGCPPDGIIGNGSDLATRQARAKDGFLALNGGGGEIYRNFFYLPPARLLGGRFTVRDMVWTFYSQYDPRVTTARFDERRYEDALTAKVAAIFGPDKDQLTRTEVEFVYPGFRGRFWTGLNTAFNNHLGAALTPFFEFSLVEQALGVPLALKNHGQFEGALIAAIDPKLAAYNSDYGHDFLTPPTPQRRLKDWTTYLRPPRLRRLTYRIKNRMKRSEISQYFTADYRNHYLPGGTPVMSRFFHVEAIDDGEQLNRILTLEYLCTAYGIGAD